MTKKTKKIIKKAKKAAPKKKIERTGILGKNWGLNISQSWEKVFKENERPSWHKTDEQISERMQKEFPGRKAAMLTDPEQVKVLRSMFNRDSLRLKRTFSKGVVSYAYDKNGKQIKRGSKGGSKGKTKKAESIKKKKVVIIKRGS